MALQSLFFPDLLRPSILAALLADEGLPGRLVAFEQTNPARVTLAWALDLEDGRTCTASETILMTDLINQRNNAKAIIAERFAKLIEQIRAVESHWAADVPIIR